MLPKRFQVGSAPSHGTTTATIISPWRESGAETAAASATADDGVYRV